MSTTCLQCTQKFETTAEDLEFYSRVSPVISGITYPVPSPSLCPRCRQQRRLAWRNEQNLYRRDCSLCKRSIISVHPSQIKFPVYCVDCWWSDKWNPLDFGLDYNQDISFLEQFKKLQDQTIGVNLHLRPVELNLWSLSRTVEA